MEKSNKRIIKIALIVIIAIICIYAIFVTRRYCILTKVGKMQEENLKKVNYHIFVESIVGNEVTDTYETWMKDDISKTEVKTIINEDTVNTFWRNANTGEKFEYSIVGGLKSYTKFESDIPTFFSDRIETALPITENTFWERLKYALDPLKSIKTKSYNGIKCYVFEYEYANEYYEEKYVDKENGLVILKENKTKTTTFIEGNYIDEYYKGRMLINYSFDTVTDRDVAFPDLSDYELRETTYSS